MARSHRARTGFTWIVLLGLAFPTAVLFAQSAYESKPLNLPWKIAFIRDRNLWTMNGDGSGQKVFRPFGNVVGKVAWSPDGKRLAWTRQGEYTYKLPDGGGGGRRLYDLFQAEVDSTREGYWRWITFNHGSRTPEFSSDGSRILYSHEVDANIVDAELPNYQIEHAKLDGSDPVRLTRAGAKPGECQGLDPTWSPDAKQVAFVYQKRQEKVGEGGGQAPNKPIGLVIAPATGIIVPEPELMAQATKNSELGYPAWSPDGKWIACVNTASNDGGIYLVSPDLTTKNRILEKTERLVPTQAPVSWSPDSKWITFATVDGYIYVMTVDGGARPQRITSAGNDYYPSFSRK